ncbi:MAG: stage II sporulation protein P [Oscillospiraceae bacterium]|nr:stage II sporulation protein P [Oscillospiraceae bacterium]
MSIQLDKWKRYAALIGTVTTIIGSGKFAGETIPWLKQVQIGNQHHKNNEITIVSSTYDNVLAEKNMAEGFGISQSDDISHENHASSVISWESDNSAQIHQSKLYPISNTSKDGEIIEKHYTKQNGTQFFSLENGGQVRNCTFWTNHDLYEESKILPSLPLKCDGSPMVLIYHTHTTESFEKSRTGFFDASFNYRTTEPDKNMVMVGDAIAKELADAGIGVIHAAEIHDYPVWNNSYARSAQTVQSILAAYPSICIALDIHRDAISTNSTIYAPVAMINNQKSAQIMIISGCDDGTMGMPNYRENFHFASILQQTTEGMYEGFTRPILFDYRKYNQNLTNGSLLVEFGSQGNTMDEVRYAGTLFGRSLVQTIRTLTEKS